MVEKEGKKVCIFYFDGGMRGSVAVFRHRIAYPAILKVSIRAQFDEKDQTANIMVQDERALMYVIVLQIMSTGAQAWRDCWMYWREELARTVFCVAKDREELENTYPDLAGRNYFLSKVTAVQIFESKTAKEWVIEKNPGPKKKGTKKWQEVKVNIPEEVDNSAKMIVSFVAAYGHCEFIIEKFQEHKTSPLFYLLSKFEKNGLWYIYLKFKHAGEAQSCFHRLTAYKNKEGRSPVVRTWNQIKLSNQGLTHWKEWKLFDLSEIKCLEMPKAKVEPFIQPVKAQIDSQSKNEAPSKDAKQKDRSPKADKKKGTVKQSGKIVTEGEPVTKQPNPPEMIGSNIIIEVDKDSKDWKDYVEAEELHKKIFSEETKEESEDEDYYDSITDDEDSDCDDVQKEMTYEEAKRIYPVIIEMKPQNGEFNAVQKSLHDSVMKILNENEKPVEIAIRPIGKLCKPEKMEIGDSDWEIEMGEEYEDFLGTEEEWDLVRDDTKLMELLPTRSAGRYTILEKWDMVYIDFQYLLTGIKSQRPSELILGKEFYELILIWLNVAKLSFRKTLNPWKLIKIDALILSLIEFRKLWINHVNGVKLIRHNDFDSEWYDFNHRQFSPIDLPLLKGLWSKHIHSEFKLESDIAKENNTDRRFKMNSHGDDYCKSDVSNAKINFRTIEPVRFCGIKTPFNKTRTVMQDVKVSRAQIMENRAPANVVYYDDPIVVRERQKRFHMKSSFVNVDKNNVMKDQDVHNHSLAIAQFWSDHRRWHDREMISQMVQDSDLNLN